MNPEQTDREDRLDVIVRLSDVQSDVFLVLMSDVFYVNIEEDPRDQPDEM